ncbi:hypothetical protein [Microlunatus antarcticus]|uniref:Ribosomal protein S27AE n=1 Tax=Microlunatus antarcticus TaxID=53388 RepID=A0A7W5JSK8_9ACTN|nr:hypothetical protein [Microlunatus antarcticus]MBB3325480.1 ribosomal protein S27AE [Microlunatus antarcticus]
MTPAQHDQMAAVIADGHAPAICPRCGCVFQSGLHFGYAIHTTVIGGQSSCPNCGHMAAIPDGVYDLNPLIRELAAKADRESLLALVRAFRGAQGGTGQELAAAVAAAGQNAPSEAQPLFLALAKFVKSLPTGSLAEWAAVIVALLALLVGGGINVTVNNVTMNDGGAKEGPAPSASASPSATQQATPSSSAPSPAPHR